MANSDIQITEILYDPLFNSDLTHEYIEIFNGGSDPVDLAGWGTGEAGNGINTFATAGAVILGAGAYAILVPAGTTQAMFEAAYGPLPAGATLIEVANWNPLGNSGETVVLYDSTGSIVDQVTYPVTAGTPGIEQSIEITRDALGDPVYSTISPEPGTGAHPVAGPSGPTENDDILEGAENADNIDLLGGNDIFNANGGSDNIHGNAGDDTINGNCGNDNIDGGIGSDNLLGGNGNDTLIGGLGADILSGGNNDDFLDGGADSDTLNGDNGMDVLQGGDGDDQLNGGADDDTLTGGGGADIFLFARGAGQDLITDFENGTDLIDVATLGIWDISQMNITQQGNDVRIALGNANQITLANTDLTDIDGSDFLFDVAPPPPSTSNGGDTITGTSGADSYDGMDGSDRLWGLEGNDTLLGGSGRDTLYGDEGRDMIDGGSGQDQIFGGDGRDTLVGNADNDLIKGGRGADLINGGNDNDRLYGENGRDTVIGDNGNDRIWGGNGHDVLDGGAGKDVIQGDGGNDTISGGLGEDTMTGGNGADVFVFEDRMRADVITDFRDGIDLLDFSSFGFAGLGALTLSQIGTDVEIRVSTRDVLLLENIDISAIDASDFIF